MDKPKINFGKNIDPRVFLTPKKYTPKYIDAPLQYRGFSKEELQETLKALEKVISGWGPIKLPNEPLKENYSFFIGDNQENFKTGFPVLDKLGGIEPGQVMLILGKPGTGKTEMIHTIYEANGPREKAFKHHPFNGEPVAGISDSLFMRNDNGHQVAVNINNPKLAPIALIQESMIKARASIVQKRGLGDKSRGVAVFTCDKSRGVAVFTCDIAENNIEPYHRLMLQADIVVQLLHKDEFAAATTLVKVVKHRRHHAVYAPPLEFLVRFTHKGCVAV